MEENGALKAALEAALEAAIVDVVAEAIHNAWSRGARYGLSMPSNGPTLGLAIKRIASPYRCSDKHEAQSEAKKVLEHLKDLGVPSALD